jgi:hypothetical protein
MQFDEIDLIELLDLTSEDILERFEDIVEDKFENYRRKSNGFLPRIYSEE